jgi:hypothetical protein
MREPAIGHTLWAIAEGYLPGDSQGAAPQMSSHETACILNTTDQDAHVSFTLYFTDKDPVGPYAVVVPARRTSHIRLNDFAVPAPVPRDTDYACVIESDVAIVVQYTRLDTRQAENALLNTMAFPVG